MNYLDILEDRQDKLNEQEERLLQENSPWQSHIRNAIRWQSGTLWLKAIYALILVFFLWSHIFFWRWWFSIDVETWLLYIPFSAAWMYEATVLGIATLFFCWHIKVPDRRIASPNLRVSLITLTVPGSESIETVEKQLRAMVKVTYPHDSWLLVDKMHSEEHRALCNKYGVKYFSRHDAETWGNQQISQWNQLMPPFKAKTKAGNVNAWLDAYGYENYDFFVQFDIDHAPVAEYLDYTLGYFKDPDVAWVQAPSLYGNSDVSWVAKGALEQEAILQGPLQMGFYGATETPYIIGSHCTYRTSAVQEIDGFQPTRAEDHLDTVYLAAKGYKGVFIPDIIALGDAPETFDTYLGQQFAWAYSMAQVLFLYVPKQVKNFRGLQTIQFLYSQTWYPLWSLSMATLFLTPAIVLVTGQDFVSGISIWEFFQYFSPAFVANTCIYFWCKQYFPMGLSTMTWRQILLQVSRWPIVLMAIAQMLFGIQKPYMITPKGISTGVARPFSVKVHTVFLGLVLTNVIATIVFGTIDSLSWIIFALWGSSFFVFLYLIVLLMDLRQIWAEGSSFRQIIGSRWKPILTGFFLLALKGFVIIGQAPLLNNFIKNTPVIGENKSEETVIHSQFHQ